MEFFNGDIFEGVFKDNQCYKGEYRYKSESIVQGINYHWVIPADCIFRGVVPTFTGRVDIAIYDVNKNQYIGNLKNGRPHGQGTMTYANGQSETGEWVDGMSPSAYQAYLAEQEAERQRKEAEQEAERQRKEAEQKRQQELYDAKCIKMFEEYLAEQSKKYKSPSIDLSNLYGEIPRGRQDTWKDPSYERPCEQGNAGPSDGSGTSGSGGFRQGCSRDVVSRQDLSSTCFL